MLEVLKLCLFSTKQMLIKLGVQTENPGDVFQFLREKKHLNILSDRIMSSAVFSIGAGLTCRTTVGIDAFLTTALSLHD